VSERLLIIGNSGAGKTVLARRLGEASGIRVHSLDDFRWMPGGFRVMRDHETALALAREAAAQESWIVEGVFGWMAEAAMDRAQALIWLDMDWAACAEGLRARGGICGDHWLWAQDYWRRATSSSFTGHLAIFERFGGVKLRLSDRASVTQRAAALL
jgi:hypothetical protein